MSAEKMISALVTSSVTATLRYRRESLFPEQQLPKFADIVQRGQSLARSVTVGDCSFLNHYDVASEAVYKRQRALERQIMIHSQIGFRDSGKTNRSYREIWQRAGDQGVRVDRYGICLDWSMGFREADRAHAQKGTGLILDSSEAFAELTSRAPVAPHFGDFVLGMPASVENTCAALRAGATSIGNLGQYFTFRLPGWHDEVGDTEATLRAIALIAAQPVEVLIHSNLDDGFAALFTDLGCSLGAVKLEKYIIEDLMNASLSHCYGHSFSEPYKRLVFQLGLAKVSNTPGSMVYGNTVMYAGDGVQNYASLGSYLAIDAAAQQYKPTGHAINPVPITEASRIPDIDEIVDAAVFAGRVIEGAEDTLSALAIESAETDAATLVAAADRFKQSVLSGLSLIGIDVKNPFELLLALRRIGAKKLEEDFGPGKVDRNNRRGRIPVMQTSTIARLEEAAEKQVKQATIEQSQKIAGANLKICICTTDVHEYGKILLEETLSRFHVGVVDAGVHAEPEALAKLASSGEIDAIAISTYNGVAWDYLKQIQKELDARETTCPLIMGGKLNQIMPESTSSLPVDVSDKLVSEGVLVCRSIDDLLNPLLMLADQ
ncbi:MAG: hypothetical protein KTR32_12470 [Granulosicoccus sp.]|nr:hypothetical protein [Granulosicoccus sp.]